MADKSKTIPKQIERLRVKRRKNLRVAARHRDRRIKAQLLRQHSKARFHLRVLRRHREQAQENLDDIRALRSEFRIHNRLVRLARNRRKVLGKQGLTWVDGHQVANWIAEIILEARRDGVYFRVTSGIRTLDKAQYLWNNARRLGLIHYVSVAYPCTSNHCGYIFPKGAVDLSPPWNFIQWLRGQRAKGRHTKLKSYHDTVGSRDDVHFSHTGH